MLDPSLSQSFLSALFGETLAASGLRLSVWSLPSRKTSFHRDPATAAAKAQALAETEDAYFGLGLLATPPAGKQRGDLTHIGGITCLWADIDIAGEGHSGKKTLPPTLDAALSILDLAKVEPSIIIHSGHGLQCYWLLDKPWIFQTPADRDKAVKFSKAWGDTLRFCAHKLGYEIDSVFDLTRVMRVPGTANRKGEPIMPVRLLEPQTLAGDLYRTGAEKFEMFFVPEELTGQNAQERKLTVSDPVFPVEVEAPPEVIMLLCENDARFRRTWERKRTDLKDQSGSGYDFSLVNQLVAVGASDQDIANALAFWRKKHGESVAKVMRRDYLMRTISRARTDAGAANAIREIEQCATLEPIAPGKGEQADAKREKTLTAISQGLGINIAEMVKQGKERSIYSFKLADGRDVVIGSMARLLDQQAVRVALADASGVVIKSVKTPVWHVLVQSLMSVARFVDNPEGERAKQIADYLSIYLDEHQPVSEESGSEEVFYAFKRSLPYICNQRLHISANHFVQFIRMRLQEKFDRNELWDLFRIAGLEAHTSTLRDPKTGQAICRSMWECWAADLGISAAPANVRNMEAL